MTEDLRKTTEKHQNHENIKLFWTGHSWDCFWGGYSPESYNNTPVPPLSGYDHDQGNCNIQIKYILDPNK